MARIAQRKLAGVAAFRLEQEYLDLIEEISRLTRRGKVEEIRIMLDARAAQLGLKPVRPVDPRLLKNE